MTVPRVSKRVTYREKRGKFVTAFVETYRQEVIEALDHYLRGGPPEPTESPAPSETMEGLPRPSSQPFLDGLTGRLEQALERLLKAEKVHLNEVSNDAELRRRRDEAVHSLRQDIFQARELLRGAYSRLQTQRLGFESRIADDPVALLRQALRIESILSRPGDQGLTPYFPGVEVNREPVVRAIRSRRRELRQALDDVTRDLGKVHGPLVAKDQAMKDFDETYRWVVRSLIQAFRMAGMAELAARIPISPARRSRKKADAVEQASTIPATADTPPVAS